MHEEVTISLDGDIMTAGLNCDIDHHTAKRTRERIDLSLFELKPRTLIIDFSRVGFMDSSGIALILGRCERAAEIDATVKIIGPSDSILKLLRLAGLDRIKNLKLLK